MKGEIMNTSYLELTDEQLEAASGGLGDVEVSVPVSINIAIAPQTNIAVLSDLINSKLGGTGIGQTSLVAAPQNQTSTSTTTPNPMI
jgi:hypothetical protein